MARTCYYRDLVFEVPDTVYPPEEDSALLAEHVEQQLSPTDHVWDLGTGSGILAIVARMITPYVVASDVNPYAIGALHTNCLRNSIPRIPGFIGSLDAPLRRGYRFSRIIFNAPYLPSTRRQTRSGSWIDYAWSGGRGGREVVNEFLALLPRRLEEGGSALLAFAERRHEKPWLSSAAEEQGIRVRTLEKTPFFYETLVIAELAISTRGSVPSPHRPFR